ncbi:MULTISPECIES: TonB-dependent receptor [unclassified Butyricimonas]|uniref:SusC/RagA family TonB-linked outer membrane protein n=1 Tax=unclassified Butyricimonas TaxID=2637652 RepID=UPI00159B8466|nr:MULTISPECIES: TonB-dependent receptor [unclassified Butyricimonas]
MKLFLFLMLVFTFGVHAAGYSQKQLVTLDLEQCDVNSLFREIWKQTGLRFVYNEKYVAEIPLLDVKAEKREVKEVLDEIFKNTSFECIFENNVVFVSKRAEVKSEQKKTKKVVLKGKVTDENGEPMPGVAVYIASTNIGTTTDVNGLYNLSMYQGNVTEVIYSFIGMQKETFMFPRNKDMVHDVTLKEDVQMIEDVVVIGYGTKSQRDVTSSVGSIRSDQLMKSGGSAANSFDNMLGGSLKGVLVTQNSGAPGAAATVNIRGVTSPLVKSSSSNEPLYVIDGVPFFNSKDGINPLSVVAPDDIESIDVLKDAAATSIYGSRGANGVIIVKTKSGRRNEKMNISIGYTLSVGNPVNEHRPLNRSEFMELQEEMYKNSMRAFNEGNFYADPAMLPFGKSTYNMETGMYESYGGLDESYFGAANTNWVKEIKNKNALTHQYSIALRGGGEKTNYSFSFNASNQEGLFINDKLERCGARLSFDTDVNQRIKAGASLGYTFSKQKQGDSSGDQAWTERPDIPVYSDGKYTRIDASLIYGYEAWNPNLVAKRRLVQNKTESYQFMGSSYLEYEVIENLKLHGDINMSVFQSNDESFTPKAVMTEMIAPWSSPSKSILNTGDSRMATSSINLRADYQFSYGAHRFNAMVGYGWDRTFNRSTSNDYEDFPDDNVLNNVNSAVTATGWSSGKATTGLNSVYARVGYVYADKYLAEFNFRSDASSKFGPSNKRGYFPSISLGWRANKENFMKRWDWMNDLKLRVSYGQTGSTNVEDFAYIQFFNRGSKDLWGQESTIGLKDVMPNKDVKWEMTSEYNVGLDYNFWNYRLYGSVDYYNRYTDGALAPAPASLESGFSTYTANMIDMSNQGLEVEVGGEIIRKGDWSWMSTLNVAFNRNKIEKLNGATLDATQSLFYVEGKPAGIMKGYVVEKIFQTQAEVDELNRIAQEKGFSYYYQQYSGPGDYKFKDLNGNGTVSPDDYAVIANPEPNFFGGFYNSVNWRNLNLSFMFQFSEGATASYETLRMENGTMAMQSIQRELFGNTWTPENTNARYARLVPGSTDNVMQNSDRYVFKTSYLRLKNITLSYNLPVDALRRFNLQNVQLFASVSNIWTWTKWPGIDPESVSGGDPTMGVGAGSVSNIDPYPLSKTFSFGVKIQF